jgi:hypothetical protein
MSHITSVFYLVSTLLYVSVTGALAGQPAPVTGATPRSVTLYLQADSNGPSVGTAVINSELRQQSKPHENAQRPQERWFLTEKKVTLTGYVNNRDLLKDLSIRPEAPVYQDASAESPVLLQWQKGDQADYGDVRGSFTQISFTKTLPVYFLMPVAATVAPAPKPPLSAPRESSTPKPDGDPISPPISTYRFLSDLPANPKQLRYFVGTFRPYEGIVREQRMHPFEIIGSDNRRIAFINADKVAGTEPLDRLYHKKVLITGTVKKIEKSSNYLIEAISIRPREN